MHSLNSPWPTPTGDLLQASGPGSFTHPDATRALDGDRPLSIKQKLIALCTDPTLYVLVDHVAHTGFKASPGTLDYRRHVTYFLVDVESRCTPSDRRPRPT